jgi:hypothetical protein
MDSKETTDETAIEFLLEANDRHLAQSLPYQTGLEDAPRSTRYLQSQADSLV